MTETSDARKRRVERTRPASIVIPLPWDKPPLSQNDRQHHRVKALKVAAALGEARGAVVVANVAPIVGAEITLHYRVADKRRRDADNLAVVLKVCQDALVAEQVIPRDDWVCVPASGQRIHAPNGEPAAMWLELDQITHYEESA